MKGSKQFLSDVLKVHLINEVKEFPCLYNSTKDSNHNIAARKYAWTQVAQRLKLNGQEQLCKDIWKGLKEKYKRQKQVMSSPGDGSSVLKWSLFDSMKFIEPVSPEKDTSFTGSSSSTIERKPFIPKLPHVLSQETAPDINGSSLSDTFSSIISDTRCKPNESEGDNQESTGSTPLQDSSLLHTLPSMCFSNSFDESKPSAKRPKVDNYSAVDNSTVMLLYAVKDLITTKDEEPTNDMLLFFKSVAMDVQKLSSERKRKLKLEVLRLSCSLLQEQESEDNSPPK